MSWAPDVGEVLQNADSAYGIQEKLAGYSLKLEHESGGAKARAFGRVLRITADDLDYLAAALLQGIQVIPVSERAKARKGRSVRSSSPLGGSETTSVGSRTC